MRQDRLQGIRRTTFAQQLANGQGSLEQRIARLEQALGENFRDADDAQRAGVVSYLRDVTQIYTEPMYLQLSSEPKGGIKVLRVRKVGDEETPVACGGMVHFVWEGAQNRARIISIDGMTPGTTQQYRFNFEVVT